MSSEGTTTYEELEAELGELEAKTPPVDSRDVEGWQQWLDELKVRTHLGQQDAGDVVRDAMSRLDNAWRAFRSEVDQAGDDAKAAKDDIGRVLGDLGRAARAALEAARREPVT